jgi:hypothetical protein
VEVVGQLPLPFDLTAASKKKRIEEPRLNCKTASSTYDPSSASRNSLKKLRYERIFHLSNVSKPFICFTFHFILIWQPAGCLQETNSS